MKVEIGVVYTRDAFSCLFRGVLMNPRNKWVKINQIFCSVFFYFYFSYI